MTDASAATTPARDLDRLGARRILVCAGAGGVGKTTTAAALGVYAAEAGKRACVVTIDPARRLADALDLAQLSDEPHAVPGDFDTGELYALMLDPKATFDHLVDTNAKDEEQAERIKSNRLYRNLVSALAGTQEYMASEKLYELYQSRAFDLIIVDTPPTRFALDFLAAPARLVGFLDNKVFRLLVSPGRSYLRAFSVASQLLLKTIARVAGAEIVEDTVAFFQAFDGIEAGFKERAARVEALLGTDETGFVLISSPRPEAIEQAHYFAGRVAEAGHRIDALIINRATPAFGDEAVAPLATDDPLLAALVTNLEELREEALRERRLVEQLSEKLGQPPTWVIPLLEADVHDVAALERVVEHLRRQGSFR